MWEKIKSFFSRFWWIVLVPVAIFVLHLVFRKETPELDKLIKEKKKDIEEKSKDKDKAQKNASDAKEDLETAIDTSKDTKSSVDARAEVRDETAKEFFR